MRHPFKLDLIIESVPTQAVDVLSMFEPWARQFVKKNQDYNNSGGAVSDNFGLMGQFMKLTDKIHKLRKPMWDDEINRRAGVPVDKLHFESAEEILDDIIGHAMLAKLEIKSRREAIPKKGMKEPLREPFSETVSQDPLSSKNANSYVDGVYREGNPSFYPERPER